MAISGIRIVVPGVNFARNVAQVAYPVTAALQALFYFGRSEGDTSINWATGKPPGTMSGAPERYADGYCRFVSNSSYLQTSAYDSEDDITIIFVVRSVSGGAPIVSNHNGVLGLIDCGTAPTNGWLQLITSNAGGADTVTADRGVANQFSFVAMVVEGTTRRMTFSDAGELITVAGAAPFQRTRSPGVPFRINRRVVGGNEGGTQDISMVAIHSKALSTADIEKTYKYLRSRLAKQGVAI